MAALEVTASAMALASTAMRSVAEVYTCPEQWVLVPSPPPE